MKSKLNQDDDGTPKQSGNNEDSTGAAQSPSDHGVSFSTLKPTCLASKIVYHV
jgi:hypothetical protein